ncbi:hypothetical protein ABIC27_005853 [Streptomyces sp. PvR034]
MTTAVEGAAASVRSTTGSSTAVPARGASS